MKKPSQLLAKSYDRKKYQQPPDYALYTQHNRDVAYSCKALAQVVGAVALANAGLDENLIAEFNRTLLANGWIQDLGKANSHFQAMVSGQSEIIQLLRHETISGLLVCLEPRFQEWLAPLGEKVKLIAVWGAIGHHRKFDDNTFPKKVMELKVYTSDDDFKANLKEMAQDLDLAEPPIFESDLTIAPNKDDICDFLAGESLDKIKAEFRKLESVFADEQSRRFVALVKALGIAADGAASGVAKKYKLAENYSLADFVTENLSKGLKPSDLTTLIYSWAWKSRDLKKEEIDLSKLPPGFVFRTFQENVKASESYLTFAQAGCGSGKSIAAYLWAHKWCDKLEKQGRNNLHIFFCLPTTGTTTEHFKDYALESGIPPELISLTHSRSSVDLETMAETAIQEEANEEENDIAKTASAALKAQQDKIEGLALWSTPLIVTTADTVLGLMANARRAIYSTPAIMQSVIVFDEIHAFDDYLFGHLLVFLKNFPRLPVLLMTASLPEQRRLAIEKVRPDLCYVPGDEKLETLPRYHIQYPVNHQNTWDAVEKCIANNGKVLWVRNRVEWANETYTEAKAKFPDISVNVYHSRLRYKDRSDRHRQVIDDFKQKGKAAILVATQVAEMSLDLSADLLITDIAPPPALIQRMGRLNRRATPDNPGEPKPALICSLPAENQVSPYSKEELKTAKTWVEKLKALNQPLNQKDLADKFAEVSDVKEYDYKEAEKRACFFGIPKNSGLWRTRPGSTREQGYTISVILKADYEAWKKQGLSGEPDADWIRKHEVAVPIRQEALKWEQVAGIRIAPNEAIAYNYNEQTREGVGARWL